MCTFVFDSNGKTYEYSVLYCVDPLVYCYSTFLIIILLLTTYNLFLLLMKFFSDPGTMFSVGVFSHLLQIDDALIGVMSCMSKILAGFVYAFATTEFVFYLGAYY